MNTKIIASLAMSIGLTGCVAPTVNISAQFNADQAAIINQVGKNTITGSALIKRNDGVAVTCAGAQVTLIPVTAYATERMQYLYKNTTKGVNRYVRGEFASEVPEYKKLMKYTQCNAQGFFTFKDIADGDYYLTTTVRWTVGYNDQGGHLMLKVSVLGGQTVDVVLAP
jgi:hypothetical protein